MSQRLIAAKNTLTRRLYFASKKRKHNPVFKKGYLEGMAEQWLEVISEIPKDALLDIHILCTTRLPTKPQMTEIPSLYKKIDALYE